MAAAHSVSITDLTKTYRDLPALDAVSLDISRGSRTVVLGHNGAGKSTLLEIVATLRTPTSGTVTVEGFDTVRDARDARRVLGLAPQANALDPLATPVEVLSFQASALGMGRTQAARRRDDLLDLLGIGEHRRTRVAALSGGTRRKLDLAVALVGEPQVLVLDEPTTGLDPMSRLDLWAELKRLNDEGRTLVVSTQDLHEADVLATQVLVLRDGKVVAHDTPAALKRQVGERTLTLGLTGGGAARDLLAQARSPFVTDAADAHVLRLALTDDGAALGTALGDLGACADDITTLTLAEPSLDDVFLALAAR